MGAGIGQRLTEHKVTVLTSLAGRTEASAKRAREAGMQPVEDRALAEADFLLSIVPPGDAVALATPTRARADCRQQETGLCRVQRGQPADDVENSGCDRRDRVPLRGRGHHRPTAKAGQHEHKDLCFWPVGQRLRQLNDYGLIVRVLEGPLTAASAFKMSYAGITKGFTALGAAMMLAATRGGSADGAQGRACR